MSRNLIPFNQQLDIASVCDVRYELDRCPDCMYYGRCEGVSIKYKVEYPAQALDEIYQEYLRRQYKSKKTKED